MNLSKPVLVTHAFFLSVTSGCVTTTDYAGVDPEVLEDCRADATATKGILDGGLDRGRPGKAYENNSAQTAIDEARAGQAMLESEKRDVRASWPLDVMINQCLIEYGQPISTEAANEVSQWVSGQLP